MENPMQEFVYGSCMKNHVAKLGGHVTDGCGEFFSINGGSQCGACGCHQNFHQKIAMMRRGGSADRKGENSSDETEDEKNLQELMVAEQVRQQQHPVDVYMSRGRRPRTKFTEEQRQRMFEFATRLGWRMQRDRWEEINQFCQQIGVPRHIFRVWLNNHKN
ncbi:zinc-finger homeodomain protein 10-like [Macadamia integrifolia]|uniref:zinc-finger homeodomain protein 10-like n=1 Tax=Macadamia integrifolia TaxID=60698 RepID=UPI001C4F17C5|nr:zinc-finger homeodomain protein 10-like [Macadamia integrifolia]